MPIWDHLDELRSRFIKCAWIFFAGFIGFYFLSDHLLDWLRRPLFQFLPPDRQHLYYTSLFENFLVHLRVSAYASLLFLSPLYFFILWGFIAPGLKKTERKAVLPFVLASSLFFLLGSAFAYFFLFPKGVQYFLSYGTSAEVALLTLEQYVSLILKILFGFGVAFQLPVILILLAKVGLIHAQQMIEQRKLAFIAITLISAVVAPPDAISMICLMFPLYLLYEGAIVIVRIIQKNPSQSKSS